MIRDLYRHHRGQFSVAEWPHGDPSALTEDERSSIDAVLGFYGGKSAHELSELTHRERPWRKARTGVPVGGWSSNAITDADMFEYYDGLTSSADA